MRFRPATSNHIHQAVRSAAQELVLTLPDAASIQDVRAADLAAARQAARAGVAVRAYVHTGGAAGPEAETILEHLIKDGVTVRQVTSRVPRMWIVDRAVLAFDEGEPARPGAAIGRDPSFAELLLVALDTDPATHAPEPAPEPDSPDGAVLRHLASGAKDTSAAREMGMALRTYRRSVARLMDQLNARSRFQAGYRAALNEWLRP
ncbi:hypothetical protein Acy02nite_89110 [Actinoplanes cyaneus]|uniref:HTH luxR-type domain-containing protein n=1 Tax=Actinoplanes cyaneus TaxID=52696 RepID=A0A919M608_9ACTN|nr:hypothetical protein [Actinoplanes cyaneus]MCW2144257.1 hypothetical protein [Actinoplanes cyaneus]GID71030.1 hypothetical protein Acy02nite_89110 [Actinoplanes cyaneus]